MKIAVTTSADIKEDLFRNITDDTIQLIWQDEPTFTKEANCYIDLLFTGDFKRIELLASLLPALVIVNSNNFTCSQLSPGIVRINAWPGFLQNEIIEAACNLDETKKKSEEVFALLGKKIEWVADRPGFVTPRIISMIVNEAYLALEEGVSTKDEIDTAMKSGTNYPYGPFEWATKIGIYNIYSLLQIMAEKEPYYHPAPLLKQEALNP